MSTTKPYLSSIYSFVESILNQVVSIEEPTPLGIDIDLGIDQGNSYEEAVKESIVEPSSPKSMFSSKDLEELGLNGDFQGLEVVENTVNTADNSTTDNAVITNAEAGIITDTHAEENAETATDTNLLTPHLIQTLHPHFSPILQESRLNLLYSLDDGSSLSSLLRSVEEGGVNGVLVVIGMEGEVFGG